MTSTEHQPGYEAADLNSTAVTLVAVILVLGLLFSSIVCLVFYQAVSVQTQKEEGPLAPPVPLSEQQFPHPQLQARDRDDLVALRQAEEQELHRYQWIDEKAGVVRVPIERAMALFMQRGEPAGANGAPGPTWEEMMRARAEAATSVKKP